MAQLLVLTSDKVFSFIIEMLLETEMKLDAWVFLIFNFISLKSENNDFNIYHLKYTWIYFILACDLFERH